MNECYRDWTTLTQEFRADVQWFLLYSETANRLSLISPIKEYVYIECDSSLLGGGGNSDRLFYKWEYSDQHRSRYPNIHMLEAVNLLVAYRTLCPPNTAGKCIVIATDNLASHFALTTGRTRDSILGACARELWLEAARADEIVHKQGSQIPLADALSRFYSDPSKALLALKVTADRNLSEISPNIQGCAFFNEI